MFTDCGFAARFKAGFPKNSRNPKKRDSKCYTTAEHFPLQWSSLFFSLISHRDYELRTIKGRKDATRWKVKRFFIALVGSGEKRWKTMQLVADESWFYSFFLTAFQNTQSHYFHFKVSAFFKRSPSVFLFARKHCRLDRPLVPTFFSSEAHFPMAQAID